MKERGILFSAPMVRALLDGSKTQTRRVLKPQPDEHHWQLLPGYELKRSKIVTINDRCAVKFSHSIPQNPHWDTALDWLLCPYGQPGDRLWVRETWMPDAPRNGEWPDVAFYGCGMSPLDLIPECYRHPWHCLHRATYEGCELRGWKPSIHMPRWASRITLEITGVRVERLQDISETDCVAEGIRISGKERRSDACYGIYECRMPDGKTHFNDSAHDLYRTLWKQINGPDSWDANPWVWVVEFKRITP